MTIPASTAPAVRQFFFDQLTASLTPDMFYKDSRLLVCYDTPGPDEPDDVVSVGKVERQFSIASMVGGGGAGWLDEKYSLTITVDVFRGGDDPQYVYSRAATLMDAVVQLIRTDPSLGGLVLIARPDRHSAEVDWDDKGLGRHCTAELTIECLQRI